MSVGTGENITASELRTILEREPFLCDWGYAPPYLRSEGFNFDEDRQSLSNRLKEVRICCEWLKQRKPRKTINPAVGSSYALKHMVEKWAGEYVTNGSFIVAVIYLGIKLKFHPDSPNVLVALSSRDSGILSVI